MLTLLVDHTTKTVVVPETGSKLAYRLSNPVPRPPIGGMRDFVLLEDGVPVVKARLYLSDRSKVAIIKHISTDYDHRRKGYSTRMTELLNEWAAGQGRQLQSDWELSEERLPFWLKQVAKGRAVMTNPDDPSETAYRLTVPPGTNLDGFWAPWSPPWGRR